METTPDIYQPKDSFLRLATACPEGRQRQFEPARRLAYAAGPYKPCTLEVNNV